MRSFSLIKSFLITVLVISLASHVSSTCKTCGPKGEDSEPDEFPVEDTAEDTCSNPPRGCCEKFDWLMITDPNSYNRKTGCDVKCCRSLLNKNRSDARSVQLRRSLGNQFRRIKRCLRALRRSVRNMGSFPSSCCQLAMFRWVPVCSDRPQPDPPRPRPIPPGPRPDPGPGPRPIPPRPKPDPGPEPGPGPKPIPPQPKPNPDPEPGPKPIPPKPVPPQPKPDPNPEPGPKPIPPNRIPPSDPSREDDDDNDDEGSSRDGGRLGLRYGR